MGETPDIVLNYRSIGLTMTHQVPLMKIIELRDKPGTAGSLTLKMKKHWDYLVKFLIRKSQKTLFVDHQDGVRLIGICQLNTAMEMNGRTWTMETYWPILDIEIWKDQKTWFLVLGREIEQ